MASPLHHRPPTRLQTAPTFSRNNNNNSQNIDGGHGADIGTAFLASPTAVGSQNSPDSAIGTSTASAQGSTQSAGDGQPTATKTTIRQSDQLRPPLKTAAKPNGYNENAFKSANAKEAGDKNSKGGPRRQKPAAGGSLLGLPLAQRLVCERDFERIVKETELLTGSRDIDIGQMLAESRLSRECLLLQQQQLLAAGGKQMQPLEGETVQESRRYYLFDPTRHEYRLYYAREVRLRSESNLAAHGLEEEEAERKMHGRSGREDSSQWRTAAAGGIDIPCASASSAPLRRRHSAGAGRLRRAVPPPKNGLLSDGNNGTENGWRPSASDAKESTTQFPISISQVVGIGDKKSEPKERNGKGEEEEARANQRSQQQHSAAAGQQQQQHPAAQPLRRGAFERNSASRKPLQLQARGGPPSSDPPRRRQWSGGAKRAAALKQQELEQQRRLAAASASSFTSGAGNGSAEQLLVVVDRRGGEEAANMADNMGQPQPTRGIKPTPAKRQNNGSGNLATGSHGEQHSAAATSGEKEAPPPPPPAVTNQMLRELLRPLHRIQGPKQSWQPTIEADGQPETSSNWPSPPDDRERLLAVVERREEQPAPASSRHNWGPEASKAQTQEMPKTKSSSSIWDCFKWKKSTSAKKLAKVPSTTMESQHHRQQQQSPARLQRLLGCLLCALLALVAAAGLAIVVLIWYI